MPDLPTPPAPRVLSGLTCAACGGTLEVQEGWTNVSCRYCETPLAVVGERGVTRLMVLDELDRDGALAALRAWFGRGVRKEPALKREAVVEEAFLAFLPFVHLHCDVVGWVLGVKLKRRKKGNRWEQVEEPVEREVEREVDATAPAAEVAELGVQRVNLAGDTLLPLDEEALRKRGMLFRPSRAEAEVAATLSAQALSEAERSVAPDRVTFSWLRAISQRVSLVYYPLWVLRYGFRGRTYQALVDAEDGALAFGKAPGNHLYRAGVLVGTVAAACFVATTALQHADSWLRGHDSLAGAAAVGIGLFALIRWGYAQFRRGGVVEEGTGLAADKRPERLDVVVKRYMEKIE